jgi:CcmD family protein
VCGLAVATPVSIAAQGQPAARDEYVPISELPPDEEMPAAPMVIGAYMFVWVAFVAYVFTLVNRTKKLEADLDALERRERS